MTPSLKAITPGTHDLPTLQVLAERPTVTELRLRGLDAIRRGDYRRAVAYQRCIYRRLDEANEGEAIRA